jgi:uncharacterized protein YdhG (YjbR/CyaY superfamily)
MTVSDDIDAYLAGLPADQRNALQTLRESIAAAAPGTDEGFSYGAPAFRYRDRPLVCYSAAKAHLSFFPMSPEVIEAHQAELTEWSTSKGTIRFTPDHPLPAQLVETLVQERIAELDAAASR